MQAIFEYKNALATDAMLAILEAESDAETLARVIEWFPSYTFIVVMHEKIRQRNHEELVLPHPVLSSFLLSATGNPSDELRMMFQAVLRKTLSALGIEDYHVDDEALTVDPWQAPLFTDPELEEEIFELIAG